MIVRCESGGVPWPHPAVVDVLCLLGKRCLALAIYAATIIMVG